MNEKIKWCKAKDAGKYFGLNADEVADLVAVMAGYESLFGDLDLKQALGIAMRMSNFEFCVTHVLNDFEHGSTMVEIHRLSTSKYEYGYLEFSIHVDSFAHHRLSHSPDFPHNLIKFLAGEINDQFLQSDMTDESERSFAQNVYDALKAVAEKRILESKFGGVRAGKKIGL
ncbi:hypothetical protein [Burkholderia glumae]|uniref:hypothetical protein n=1 Tax=Burkholderia glumae TaxID=337 RepID=UPI001462BDAF|nr:hypothetical protein [Burkholderia glumae]QJP73785.1 hypothetical protein HJC54_27680 [Burkholderia glumae]